MSGEPSANPYCRVSAFSSVRAFCAIMVRSGNTPGYPWPDPSEIASTGSDAGRLVASRAARRASDTRSMVVPEFITDLVSIAADFVERNECCGANACSRQQPRGGCQPVTNLMRDERFRQI